MIILIERFDVLSLYKKIFTKVLTMKYSRELSLKISLWLEKAIFVDTIFYYFSLRLLYTKFCLESCHNYVAYSSLSSIQDHLNFIKTDITNRSLITMNLEINEKTFEILKNSVYRILYITKNIDELSTEVPNIKFIEKSPDDLLNDKYFNFLTYFKATIMKYYTKLDM